jgi:hypothetical protein
MAWECGHNPLRALAWGEQIVKDLHEIHEAFHGGMHPDDVHEMVHIKIGAGKPEGFHFHLPCATDEEEEALLKGIKEPVGEK